MPDGHWGHRPPLPSSSQCLRNLRKLVEGETTIRIMKPYAQRKSESSPGWGEVGGSMSFNTLGGLVLLLGSEDLGAHGEQRRARIMRGRDFTGGPMVKNLPCNAADMGLIPGQGSKIPHAVERLSLCTPTTEPQAAMRESVNDNDKRHCVPRRRSKIRHVATKTQCSHINK